MIRYIDGVKTWINEAFNPNMEFDKDDIAAFEKERRISRENAEFAFGPNGGSYQTPDEDF